MVQYHPDTLLLLLKRTDTQRIKSAKYSDKQVERIHQRLLFLHLQIFPSSFSPVPFRSLLFSSSCPLHLHIDVFAPRSDKRLINSRGDQIRSQQDDGSGNHLLWLAHSAKPQEHILRMIAWWNDELCVPHRKSTAETKWELEKLWKPFYC